MKTNIIGVDVGGTKCAVTYGQKEGFELHIREKIRFATTGVDETIANIVRAVDDVAKERIDGRQYGRDRSQLVGVRSTAKNGVACCRRICSAGTTSRSSVVGRSFRIRTGIHNDANACALAE